MVNSKAGVEKEPDEPRTYYCITKMDMPKRHRRQLEWALTGHTGENLVIKINDNT